MNLEGLALFARISRRMHWLGNRQGILAENVANANTPGYRARDLQELKFRDLVAGGQKGPLRLAATDAAHLAPTRPRADFAARELRDDLDPKVTENSVDLETELAKVAETSIQHQTMTNLYRRHMAMLKTAIGRGG
jgi:flagellar basal-body rod protein FlgB